MYARGILRAPPKGLAQQFPFSVDDERTAISTRFLTENQHASIALLKQRLHPSF